MPRYRSEQANAFLLDAIDHQTEVERLGLTNLVQNLYVQGKTIKGISEELKRLGHNIGSQGIANYLTHHEEIARRIVGKQETLQIKLLNQQFDVHDKLIETTQGIEKKIKELEGTQDYANHLGYVREMRAQLELIYRLLGKLTPALQQLNINQTNILNPADISKAFKQELFRWFRESETILKDGTLVFCKPSSELLRDYTDWEEKEKQSARSAGVGDEWKEKRKSLLGQDA